MFKPSVKGEDTLSQFETAIIEMRLVGNGGSFERIREMSSGDPGTVSRKTEGCFSSAVNLSLCFDSRVEDSNYYILKFNYNELSMTLCLSVTLSLRLT